MVAEFILLFPILWFTVRYWGCIVSMCVHACIHAMDIFGQKSLSKIFDYFLKHKLIRFDFGMKI